MVCCCITVSRIDHHGGFEGTVRHHGKLVPSMPEKVDVRTVPWTEWCESKESQRVPLLDLLPPSLSEIFLRQAQPLRTQHDLTVVSIPLLELRDRSFELPPRNIDFAAVVENEAAQREALAILMPIGDEGDRRRNSRPPSPWSVVAVVLFDPNSPKESQHHDVREKQDDETNCPTEDPGSDAVSRRAATRPKDRLWQPDPMVASILLPLLSSKLMRMASRSDLSASCCYEIWDLGAGSGRDVCFLAEELQSVLPATIRFRVVAIDQRYRSQPAVSAVQSFWLRRSVSHVTECRCIDLDDAPRMLEDLGRPEDEGATVVLCMYAVRYWNRSLITDVLSWMGSQRQVMGDTSDRVGCTRSDTFVFATSHFCRPTVNAPWNFDHPRPRNVLARHELRDMFTGGQGGGAWSILHDNIVQDSDHGRTLVHFVAECEK